jgi:drug/metabolite transporter (DMT)-like permease
VRHEPWSTGFVGCTVSAVESPEPVSQMSAGRRGVVLALVAALLFGLSTPAAKILLSVADPWLLAGLLYLGSGLGLGCLRVALAVAGRGPREAPIRRRDVPWLAAAILSGGVLGPALLMLGLAGISASEASLLLNLEGVLTAILAWFVFREHFDARIAVGMALITAGATVLASQPDRALALDRHALLVAGACLAWALDNNLTRNVAGGDAVLISALKGGTAGAVNLGIGLASGVPVPGLHAIAGALVVGFLGYGVSLTLFVRALRELGAARTSAYFSIAPFIGAAVAVIAFDEALTGALAIGGILMGIGVWLHVTERHGHDHLHDPLGHDHLHRHDAHHSHVHEPGPSAPEPHSHWHVHAPLRHGHPHYPDLHHRHRH